MQPARGRSTPDTAAAGIEKLVLGPVPPLCSSTPARIGLEGERYRFGKKPRREKRGQLA
jgi:hypothetical protein